jgi:hypothetical protein
MVGAVDLVLVGVALPIVLVAPASPFRSSRARREVAFSYIPLEAFDLEDQND